MYRHKTVIDWVIEEATSHAKQSTNEAQRIMFIGIAKSKDQMTSMLAKTSPQSTNRSQNMAQSERLAQADRLHKPKAFCTM